MSKNNLKQGVKTSRTCVYNVNYHIVFSTKYRRKVLTESVEKILKEELEIIASSKNLILSSVEVGELDHIHLFVSAKPKETPSNIVKNIKGITAKKLFERCPEIKNKLWGGHLWNPSYYIETIGSISEEAIKKYIDNQSKEPKKPE